MKGVFLLTMLVTASWCVFSQSPDSMAKEKIKELKSGQTDTIISYRMTCSGDNRGCDCCEEEEFLFWIKNGRFFRQKFDNCASHKYVELKESKFLSKVVEQIDAIRNSEIKPVENHKKDLLMIVDHTCTTHFNFYLSNEEFSKSINQFNLTTKTLDKDTKNDNYDFNQKSILKTLKDLVEKELN